MSSQHPFVKRLPFFALALCACAVLLTAFAARRVAAGHDASASAVRPNGKIAYVYQDLYTINPDGTGQAKIVDPDTEVRYPAWSPDASKIAFSRNVSPVQNLDIFVANADGTNAVRLTNAGNAPTGTNTNYGATWSPDGAKIAFTRASESRSDVFLMDADGTGVKKLTGKSGDGFSPDFSPDGKQIVFASNDEGQTTHIHVMGADGTDVRRLTKGVGVHDDAPDWRPLTHQ